MHDDYFDKSSGQVPTGDATATGSDFRHAAASLLGSIRLLTSTHLDEALSAGPDALRRIDQAAGLLGVLCEQAEFRPPETRAATPAVHADLVEVAGAVADGLEQLHPCRVYRMMGTVEAPIANCTPAELTSMLLNVADNAARNAGHSDGKVDGDGDGGDDGQVEIAVRLSGGTASVEVSDSGPGFGYGSAGRSSLGLMATTRQVHALGGHLELRPSR